MSQVEKFGDGMAEIKARGLILYTLGERSRSMWVIGQTSTCGSICDHHQTQQLKDVSLSGKEK
jgi:hypothetical protein